MKVIFLDIDGVLNYAHFVEPFHEFEPACFKNLKWLVDETGAEIVISSSWKQDYIMLAKINQELRKYGLKSIGATPNLVDRESEIQEWLKLHTTADKYVVIDDYDMSRAFPETSVWTCNEGRIGLDQGFAEQAKKILLDA